MAGPTSDAWDQLWTMYDRFRSSLVRSHAVNVNARSLRMAAQEIVQLYFRMVRPELVSLGFDSGRLEALDAGMQDLLRLSQGSNAKRSYVRALQGLAAARPGLLAAREQKLGEQFSDERDIGDSSFDPIEKRIIETLKPMLPAAALSYEQSVRDLRALDRVSLRGTAVELRETLREALDHLAPDSEVVKMPGFKPEPAQTKPTMRQKARFVFRSRGLPSTASKTAEDAVSLVEERAASLVRSTYERGSASTHVATIRGEVQQLKMYVDSVLSELLQIHTG